MTSDLTMSTIHLLVLIFFSRLTSQTGLRIIYPLAPFVEEDWNLSNEQFGLIFSISELTAIFGVLMAPFADKFGTKILSFIAYLSMSLSFIAILLNQTFFVVLFARIIFVIGYQIFFATTVSVTFGAVSTNKSKKIATLIEMSWGLSSLIGLPFTLFLFDKFGYKSLFVGFCILMSIFSLDILKTYPTYHLQDLHNVAAKGITLKQVISSLTHRSVLAFDANTTFIALSQNGMFTVFSFWMRDRFDIKIDEIGLPFFSIGLAEFLGALAITFVLFKFPRRVYILTYLAILLSILTLLLLIVANKHQLLSLALFSCLIFFLCAQFVIVFKITESPSYVEDKFRTSGIALHSISLFIGRATGAYLGESLYSTQSFIVLILFFCLSNSFSVFLLRVGEKTKRQFNADFGRNNTEADTSSDSDLEEYFDCYETEMSKENDKLVFS